MKCAGFLVERNSSNEKMGDEPIKMLVAPCPHEERFAYAFYRSIERYFLQAAPSLPTQGFDVVDTCVVIGVAVLCISACFFTSIWNAWLASTKNIENTSAAPIENRATCLYTETSLWLVMLTLHCPRGSSAIDVPVDLFEALPV